MLTRYPACPGRPLRPRHAVLAVARVLQHLVSPNWQLNVCHIDMLNQAKWLNIWSFFFAPDTIQADALIGIFATGLIVSSSAYAFPRGLGWSTNAQITSAEQGTIRNHLQGSPVNSTKRRSTHQRRHSTSAGHRRLPGRAC